MPQWRAWWQAHRAGLASRVQILFATGLVIAIWLVVLPLWNGHTQLLDRQAEMQSVSELLTLTNKICEARLDRMQGIYRGELFALEKRLVRVEEVLRQHRRLEE